LFWYTRALFGLQILQSLGPNLIMIKEMVYQVTFSYSFNKL